MSVYNIKQYKTAKILVKDLTTILSIMKDYESKLSTFSKYTPIQKLIANLQENRNIVHFHLQKQKAIVNSKGEFELEEKKKPEDV